ncbi:uncharacterized protein B0T15DRAFT_171755 [Chaetomium strumarium]|uniref:Uncharacterized protein n=1 Tax=Chaetomium strumarium TaxID=1170767 RepID=A0AAJ0GW67_9PEZI|nr:hypothetical protein B0T15DRAFT_171755 [Chaetomium strumarium]
MACCHCHWGERDEAEYNDLQVVLRTALEPHLSICLLTFSAAAPAAQASEVVHEEAEQTRQSTPLGSCRVPWLQKYCSIGSRRTPDYCMQPRHAVSSPSWLAVGREVSHGILCLTGVLEIGETFHVGMSIPENRCAPLAQVVGHGQTYHNFTRSQYLRLAPCLQRSEMTFSEKEKKKRANANRKVQLCLTSASARQRRLSGTCEATTRSRRCETSHWSQNR